MNPHDLAVSIDDIRQAGDRISDAVVRTPTIRAPKLSELTGADVYVKYETMQATNSFKDRGALNKLLSLYDEERRRGVIGLSAGNHAQSVAYHAARLGIPATIVMPETTPFVKIANTEAFGAKVVLSGATVAECKAETDARIKSHGLVLVHPYDDPHVIAGQGTVALEVLADEPDIDMMVIPIGGGGLISGCAIAAKAISNTVEIIGVEAALFPSMHAAVAGKEPVCGGQTLAEGIAVKRAGNFTLPAVKAFVSDIVLVNEPQIEQAICAFASLQRTMAEGAAAASLAALLAEPERFRGKRVCLCLTGGNIDPRILSSIMVRGLEREDKIISLRIIIPDEPGVLGRISTTLGVMRANILEVSHKRTFLDVPAKGATLDLMIETKDGQHSLEVIRRLEEDGYKVTRLTGLGNISSVSK